MTGNTQLTIVTDQFGHMENGIATIKDDLMAVVMENKEELYDAVTEGQKLIDTIKSTGYNDDIDEQCADYIKRMRAATKSISDRRKPVTQIFDMVKKGFTQMESMLSPKNDESVVAQIQKARDAWAKKKFEEHQAIERERQRQAAIKAEKQKIEQDVRMMCENIYHTTLTRELGLMNTTFSLMTLDNADVVKEKIEQWSGSFNLENEYADVHPNYWITEISNLDLANIQERVIAECKASLEESYRNKIDELRKELLMYFDSKVTELKEQKRLLEEAKTLAEEEAKRVEEERKAREEAVRLAEERRKAEMEQHLAEEQAKRESEEMIRKAQQQAEALFEQTGGVEIEKVKAKVTRRLVVETPDAWKDILSLWVTDVAHTCKYEDVCRRLEPLRKDLEKFCNKNDNYPDVKGGSWVDEIKAK